MQVMSGRGDLLAEVIEVPKCCRSAVASRLTVDQTAYMSDRDALLASMSEARAQLTGITDQLTHRLGDVADSDGMRVRDLLAHFAGWQRVAARRIRTRMADGQIQQLVRPGPSR